MRKNDKNLKKRLFPPKVEKTRKTRFFEKAAILAIFWATLSANSAYSVEFRRAETMEDAHSASCRINAGNSRGTGTFFQACGSKAYIVTCQHVVGSTVDLTTDFWGNSVKQNIKGRVCWRYFDASDPGDFAIIAVDAETLKREVDPPYVPLAGSDARPTVNGFIVSSGAPDGRFTQAWKGKVVEYYQDSTAIFSPPPVPGQSGSGIMEYIDGELYITGILTWLIGEKGRDDSKGGAIPVANIYKAAKKGKRAPTALEKNISPIPPNATECADLLDAINNEINAPNIIFYTSPGCAACKSIESEIDLLEIDGERVQTIDVSTKAGYELARDDGVKKIPCVVIEKENARERVEAEELLGKDGAYTAIKRRLSSGKRIEKTTPETTTTESPQTRAPVRDDGDVIADVLEESETRWINRQGRRQERQERRQKRQEEEQPEPTPLPDDGAAKADTARLGDRIADRIADALARKVESETRRLGGTLEAQISGKLDGYKDEVKSAIVKTIFDAINEKVKKAWELTKSVVIAIVGVVALVLFYRKRKKATAKNEQS